jgi:rare lipoprotein A
VRRLVFVACTLMFLSACGAKKVQVRIPGSIPAPVSSNDLEGIASYYAEPYHGRKTANGETFDTYNELTAAHRTLPFNTVVRVTNKDNGREVQVRINDRGPFIDGRVIDLSLRAAREIDMVRAGIAPVRLTILGTRPVTQSSYNVYAVQVGAFENERAAEELRQRLERKYAGVSVQSYSGERTLYRVRIGREMDIATAQRLASELQEEDLEPFVVRVN